MGEHLVDKEAYHIAKKSEPFILHGENRSGEQDAMKEVSGTSGGGLFGWIGNKVDKTIKAAWHATKKTAGVVSNGVEKTWHYTKKAAGLGAKGVEGGYKMMKKTLFGGSLVKGIQRMNDISFSLSICSLVVLASARV